MNGTCSMSYDKVNHEFEIKRVPEVVLDLMIEAMFDRAEYKWISELLSDEEVTAYAAAGVIQVDQEE